MDAKVYDEAGARRRKARIVAIVGTLLYRCDLLEREVERLGREVPKPSSPKNIAPSRKK